MCNLISSSPINEGDQIAVITTYYGPMSLHIHARGFLEIAIIAGKAGLEFGVSIDSITPGVMYAIRHATELFLKYVIAELSEQHGMNIKIPMEHGMIKILHDHREDIKLAMEEESRHSAFDYRAWMSTFEEIINQLHQVDPDGQTLRYPFNRHGTPNLGGQIQISLAQLLKFAQHVNACFDVFDERSC